MTNQILTNDFKFNPGFKDDKQLAKDFVVRKNELKLLLQVVEGNIGASANRHVLLIGPRGVGKTTLARRIAAELRLNTKFSNFWVPIVFGEESYNITSAAEFWLECIFHLQSFVQDNALKERYLALTSLRDEKRLLEGALASLSDYAESVQKRLLIIVENLNMLFDGQLNDDDGWSFRHTLQNDPHIMILATATKSFSQIENSEYALFEQFKVHHVEPLNIRAIQTLWAEISGSSLESHQVRPIQILTGGNPRLVKILAEFTNNNVFHELIYKLAFVIDQYTDYFKSQLESLPVTERKVFVALLELWDPVLTREVAESARMKTNIVGSYLDRLERRGAVTKEGSRWQAAERLFNLYYLMRRRGAPSSRVQALVKFMSLYYAPEQLAKRVRELANEACDLKPSERQDHYHAFRALIDQFDHSDQMKIMASIPNEFFSDPNIPHSILQVREKTSRANKLSVLLPGGHISPREESSQQMAFPEDLPKLLIEGKIEEAEAAAVAYASASNNSTNALYTLALVSFAKGDYMAAERSTLQAIENAPLSASYWSLLADTQIRLKKYAVALETTEKLVSIDQSVAAHWSLLGSAARKAGAPERSLDAFKMALKIDASNYRALYAVTHHEVYQGHIAEARMLFERAVLMESSDIDVYGSYSDFAFDVLKDSKLGESILRKMTEKYPDNYRVWVQLGERIGSHSKRVVEAKQFFEKAVECAPDRIRPRIAYAEFLAFIGKIKDSEAIWEGAFGVDPNSVALCIAYGKFLLATDREEEATDIFLKATETYPQSGEAWFELANVFSNKEEKHLEAEKAYREAIQKSPHKCSPHHGLGSLLEKSGKFREAQEEFNCALKINGACGCSLEKLLTARYDFGRHVAGMESFIENLVRKFPSTGQAYLLYARYLNAVVQDSERAKGQLLIGIDRAPSMTRLWMELLTLMTAGKESNAEIDNLFSGLIQDKKPNGNLLNILAWDLHLSHGPARSEISVALARQALSKSPTSWEVLHTLAFTLCDLGEIDEAIELVPQLVSTFKDEALTDLIELVCALVRRSRVCSEKLLNAILTTERAGALEPLVVALRIASGEAPFVAAEVEAVAKDLVAQMTRH